MQMLVCSHILAGQDLEKIIKKMIIYSAVAITESKQYNEDKHKQQQKQTS